MATPIAVIQSSELQLAHADQYFARHASLASLFDYYVKASNSAHQAMIVLTHSPVSHLPPALDEMRLGDSSISTNLVNLAELSSEQQLRNVAEAFFKAITT